MEKGYERCEDGYEKRFLILHQCRHASLASYLSTANGGCADRETFGARHGCCCVELSISERCGTIEWKNDSDGDLHPLSVGDV